MTSNWKIHGAMAAAISVAALAVCGGDALAGDGGGARAVAAGGRDAYWVFLDPRAATPEKAGRLADAAAISSPRALARRARRGAFAGVRDADLPVDAAARARVRATGARLRVESRWLNALSVDATAEEIERVAALPEVASVRRVSRRAPRPVDVPRSLPAPDTDAAPGARRRAAGPPGAAGPAQLDYGPSQAQLQQIGVTALHEAGLSGAGIVIGVLDSGFDRDHPAFAAADIVAERDVVNGDDNTADEEGEAVWFHGTNVLSVLAAYDPGDMIGAAYGAEFVLAKTEDNDAEYPAEEDYWVAGLEWAESLGVDLVSSSVGYIDWYVYEQMDGMTAVTSIAASMAVERGVVVVNAVGNEGPRHMIAPGDAEAVISVGAVDATGAVAAFSSIGPTADGRIKPDVVARGVSTVIALASAGSGGSYVMGNGTSYATPLVSGVAALVLEAHPQYTPAQVQLALRETASHCEAPDVETGWGLVRGEEAVALANPGAGCGGGPVDTTGAPPRVSPISRPSGDLFAPARGPLDWSYALASAGALRCRLYDAAGRLRATILDGDFAAGEVAIAWDGRFESGGDAPSGVYFVRAESAAGVDTERVVLVR